MAPVTRAALRRGGRLGLLLVLAIAVGAILPRLVRSAAHHGPATPRYTPQYRSDSGKQVVMLYFGKASCAWSNQPQLPAEVERIKLGLRDAARARGASFEAVGVALDWSASRGLTHLAKFGEFDELATGHSWANTLALKYFTGDFAGEASTPSIIIVERDIDIPTLNTFAASLDVDGERLLARKVGVFEIEQWLDNGLPIPQ